MLISITHSKLWTYSQCSIDPDGRYLNSKEISFFKVQYVLAVVYASHDNQMLLYNKLSSLLADIDGSIILLIQ